MRERSDGLVDLSQTFLNHDVSSQGLNKIKKGWGVGKDPTSSIFLPRKNLIAEQQSEFELTQLINRERHITLKMEY